MPLKDVFFETLSANPFLDTLAVHRQSKSHLPVRAFSRRGDKPL
jgi:hypothetical protein